jgi:hypothetical protein
MIDIEVRNLIDTCYNRTKKLLLEKKDQLENLSQILLKREILFQHDLEEILGKRPFEAKAEETPTPVVAENVIAPTEIETTTQEQEKQAEENIPEPPKEEPKNNTNPTLFS